MASRHGVLLVDSEPKSRAELAETLLYAGFRVVEATDLAEARAFLSGATRIDAVVAELRLRDGSGLDLVREMRRRENHVPAVIVAEFPGTRDVVDAVQAGALDVIERPVLRERLIDVLSPALGVPTRATAQEAERASRELHQLSRPPIVGESGAIRRVLDQVARVASTPGTTVLVEGESGTGKELVARAIHFDGARRDHNFMAINCAALNESILEAELFGYESGSFTGAAQRGKKGLFEAADRGTVFLDEIGEMSQALQAKLLRVLQEATFKRVGGVQDVQVDIRIIAATNRDLSVEVDAGRFRKDLYYRLAVMPIRVPPLRERDRDVIILAQHFLERFAASMRKPIEGFSPEAERALVQHPWPGNVRELRNVCEYAVIVCDGRVVEPRHLALADRRGPSIPGGSSAAAPGLGTAWEDGAELTEQQEAELGEDGIYLKLEDFSLKSMEERLIRMVLDETRFNITRAARELGINRSTLYNKMKDYGLRPSDGRSVRETG